MGDIFDLVKGHDFDGKKEVLASINSKRLLLHPSADIDYEKLQADNDLSSVVRYTVAAWCADWSWSPFLRPAVFGPLAAENGWDGGVTRPSPTQTFARTRL